MKTPQPGRPRTPADIAKAINQGSLSVADAFHQDYSRSLSPQHPNLRVVPEELRNELLAAGELVEAQACRELAGLVAGAYFQLNPWPDDDDPAVRAVCEDLLLAGRMIAARQDLNPDMPEVERIWNAVCNHAMHYTDESWPQTDFAQRCAQVTARSRSLQVALRYIDHIIWAQRVPDLHMPIDDARYSCCCNLGVAVHEIAQVHPDAVESKLIDSFVGSYELGERRSILELMGHIGTWRSLNTLCGCIGSLEVRQAPWWWQDDFWRTILRIVERHDFSADMIRRVNEELSQRFWDARVMVRYHATLRSYAQSRSPRDPSLYQILEAKGVQYWDYWLVYPDQQGRS